MSAITVYFGEKELQLTQSGGWSNDTQISVEYPAGIGKDILTYNKLSKEVIYSP